MHIGMKGLKNEPKGKKAEVFDGQKRGEEPTEREENDLQ